MLTPAEHHAARLERNMRQTMENLVHNNNCVVYAQDKHLKARLKEKSNRRQAALEQMRQSLNTPPS